MPTPVPGQRAAQAPLTAARQSNAALGRLAQGSGPMTRYSLYEINRQWWRHWYPAGSTRPRWQNVTTGEIYDGTPAFTVFEGS